MYASIENKGGKPIAVAAVVSDIDAVRADAAGPLDGLRLPLVALGVVLLVAGLVLDGARRFDPGRCGPCEGRRHRHDEGDEGTEGSEGAEGGGPGEEPCVGLRPGSRARSGLRAGACRGSRRPGSCRGRVTARASPQGPPSRTEDAERHCGAGNIRRAGVPRRRSRSRCSDGLRRATVVPEPADEPESPMTPDREAAILRMLEDQLEQLRTKIKTQEEAAASETRQLQEELDAATRRATEAEARVGGASDAPPSVGPAERDMIERLRSLETELAQAKAAAAEAVAHAGELQRTVDAASPAGPQAASGPADSGRAGRGACEIGRRRAAGRRGTAARGRGRAARGLQRVRPRRAGGPGRTARREGGRAGAEGDRARDAAAGGQRRRRRGAGRDRRPHRRARGRDGTGRRAGVRCPGDRSRGSRCERGRGHAFARRARESDGACPSGRRSCREARGRCGGRRARRADGRRGSG